MTPAFAQQFTTEEEVAYAKTINERADKIVVTLGIADVAHSERVRKIIADQYRGLRDIQAARDKSLAVAKELGEGREAAESAARVEAKSSTEALHRSFLGKLNAEITPDQIEKVKNGLTYGVLPITYNAYMELLPNITPEQKRQILAWLYEAREYAMDGGSSNEKHGWFGKYKGRINNYLAASGINMKEAEKARNARAKAKTTPVANP